MVRYSSTVRSRSVIATSARVLQRDPRRSLSWLSTGVDGRAGIVRLCTTTRVPARTGDTDFVAGQTLAFLNPKAITDGSIGVLRFR